MQNNKELSEKKQCDIHVVGKSVICGCYPNYPDDDNYACMGCGLPLIEE